MSRRMNLLLLALMTGGTLLFGALLYRKTVECHHLEVERETLARTTQSLQMQLKVLENARPLISPHALADDSLSTIYPSDIATLRRRHLQDPVADLIADVRRHSEIIPATGTLGGRMGFYDAKRIRVLSDEWVYAPFDDGHIGGEALLSYKVSPQGTIKWTVVTSRLLQ